MNRKRLAGQTAWISGAASGMGEAIAELFAAEGAQVAAVDIQAEKGRQLVERIAAQGGQAPFHIYNLALASGLFQEVNMVKTLGVLRRCEAIPSDLSNV